MSALPFFPNVVAGRPVDAVERGRIVSTDPVTGEPWAEVADSGPGDVDAACAAAADAFSGWRRTTPGERMDALLAAADVLARNAKELAELEVRDTGKPHALVLEEEIPPSLDQVRFFAGAARLLEGRALGEYAEGLTSGVRREPVGVCGQITPWNYPFMMAVWKWAPAIAAGNTVVLKPSELTPASTLRTAELLAEVLPAGVLNVVCGGAGTGELLASHEGVAMVSLTGSVRAGRAVAAAAARRVGRVHLELGGNAPAVVFADADPDEAATGIAGSAYYNAGQDCTAAARVLVEQGAYARVVEALVAVARDTRTGPPQEPGVSYGPLVAEAHRDRVLGLLARLPDGAQVLIGGDRPDLPGWFLHPTVVTGVAQDDEIVQTEIFGPVLTVQPFRDEAEALAMANGVPYGLTASVWTRDHARAMRLLRDLEFGAVSVNAHAPTVSEMPHGGFGMSGYGKDLGLYGLEDYTRIKHVAHAYRP
ncbi:MAG: aminobutyraldehyde dehydrogenase [Actinomycetes bacterium]